MDKSSIMGRLVQVGTVTAVSGGRARVKFPDTGVISGWLYVPQHRGAAVPVNPADGHSHGVQLGAWTPKVNENVLVVYLPVPDGDGFILGVV